MPSLDSNKSQFGESRKIVSAHPKFYIKDKGTTYTTGEEFNGLWSGGTVSAPTGYGSIGHWKINEITGSTAFNNRIRGQFNLYSQGVVRGFDGNAGFTSYNLIKDTPIDPAIGSPNYYMMMGIPGSSVNEDTAFDNWLTTPGFQSLSWDGDANSCNMRYFFDIWVHLYYPPDTGEEQTLLELYHNASTTYGRVLRFYIKNNSGTYQLCMEYSNGDATTRTGVNAVVSNAAGAALYPKGAGANGGLHHIGFILDRLQLDGSSDIIFGNSVDYVEGFYVDGQQYVRSSGDCTLWQTGALEVDTNALIGCNILDPTSAFTATKATGSPVFINHLQGKIYQIQMSHITSLNEVTPERIRKLFGLRFNVPRGPSKVDFSDRFTQKGQHLLQSISQLKQAVEKDEGSFFITVQDVRLKNG